LDLQSDRLQLAFHHRAEDKLVNGTAYQASKLSIPDAVRFYAGFYCVPEVSSTILVSGMYALKHANTVIK